MADFSSLTWLFWRPEIVWLGGAFDFRTVGILFAISLVFAIGLDILLTRQRMFAIPALPAVFVAWLLAFPLFMGIGGLEVEAGFGFFSQVGSVIGGNLTSIIMFLIFWGVFEFLVFKGIMMAVAWALHHPFEAHIDAWVVGPLIEEYAFRWVLMGLLVGWGAGAAVAIAVQGVLFAISHLKNGLLRGMDSWGGIVTASITVPLGFTLGFVALNYGLLYAFLLHAVFNVVFDLVTMLTGGKAE